MKYLLLLSCLIALSSCSHGATLNGDIDALVQKGTAAAERKKNQKETFASIDYRSEVVGLLRYVPGGTYRSDSGITSIPIQFCMAETEVTQKAWQEVMGNNPSLIVDTEPEKSRDLPVNGISLLDAMKFCNQLSIKEGLEPVYYYWNSQGERITHLDSLTEGRTLIQVEECSGYRLPTVHEYRWASIGAHRSKGYPDYGTQTGWERKSFSGSIPGKNHSINDYAWYQGNSGGSLQPVKKKNPNEIGLYDLSGNAREWTTERSVAHLNEIDYNLSGRTTERSAAHLMGGDFSDQDSQLALDLRPKKATSFFESLIIRLDTASEQGLWTWQASANADLSQSPSVEVTLTSTNALTLKATNFELSEIQVEGVQFTEGILANQTFSGCVSGAVWEEGKNWIIKSDGTITGIETNLQIASNGRLQWKLGELEADMEEGWQIDWEGGIKKTTRITKEPWSVDVTVFMRINYTKYFRESEEVIVILKDRAPLRVSATIAVTSDTQIQLGTIKKASLTGQVTLKEVNKDLTFTTNLPKLVLTNNSIRRLEGSGEIKVTAPGFRVVRKPPGV